MAHQNLGIVPFPQAGYVRQPGALAKRTCSPQKQSREAGNRKGENFGVCAADMKQAASKRMESILKGEAQFLIKSARKEH